MKRLEYIDVAKGIGILLVIWGHISNHWTTDFLYTFHMPLFFVISGMLFCRDKYGSFSEFAGKRVRRLFLPYILYSVVTWAIWAGFNYIRGTEIVNYWRPLLQTVLAQGSGQFFVYNSPLWFIPCLFAVEMMYYFTSKFCDTLNLVICFVLMGTSIALEHIFGDDYLLSLPWNIDAALMALPLYAIGNIIVKHYSLTKINNIILEHKWAASATIVLVAVMIKLSLYQWNSISMGYSYYGNEWVFHLRALMGTAMVLMIAIIVANTKWLGNRLKNMLSWCGQYSLDIMCTHVPIKGVLIVLLVRMLHVEQSLATAMPLFCLLVFILTLLIDFFCVWIINHYIKTMSHKNSSAY